MLESAVKGKQMVLLSLLLIKLARKLCGFLEAERDGAGRAGVERQGCHRGIDYANICIDRSMNVLKEVI